MLHALGFPDEQMPKFLVHGWWNISGTKMSKSLGNVIDPDLLADKYGTEAIRYYLMSDMVIGQDADFLEFRIIQRYDGDLANSLGNLLNRTLSMAARYSAGSLRRGNRSKAQDLFKCGASISRSRSGRRNERYVDPLDNIVIDAVLTSVRRSDSRMRLID